MLDDDKVLPFLVWQRDYSGVSLTTAKRLRAAGKTPTLIRVSEKRLGIRLGDHREWLKARKELQ